MREGEGAAGRVLASLDVRLSTVRTKIEALDGKGDAPTPPSEINISAEMRKVLVNANEESRSRGHDHVGTEHLLLGLVRDGDGIAAKILTELAVDLEDLRTRVAQFGDQEPALRGSIGDSFGRFDVRGKRALSLAQEEAIRLKHNYIGTEHLLLGVLRLEESVAARALESLGVGLPKARTAVEYIIGPGTEPTAPSEITLSPRTKKVIELAIAEARRLGPGQAGPEHILLGIVREGQGIASGVIESSGVSLGTVREKVLSALGRADTDR